MDSFTHEQNIICSQTQLDDIAHEQTINYFWAVICRSRGGLSSNEKEEKSLPKSHLGWFLLVFGEGECKATKENMSIF